MLERIEPVAQSGPARLRIIHDSSEFDFLSLQLLLVPLVLLDLSSCFENGLLQCQSFLSGRTRRDVFQLADSRPLRSELQ